MDFLDKDSVLFGLLMSIAVTFVAFFAFKWLNSFLLDTLMDGMRGFSFRFVCILSVVANVVPIAIFNRQYRYDAAKGAMFGTMFMIFAILIYFWDQFMA